MPVGLASSHMDGTAPPLQTSTDSAEQQPTPASRSIGGSEFDIFEWHPAYQSCQRYFLDHAQHESATQAVCALVNIRLPFQWLQNPIFSSSPPTPPQYSTARHLNGTNPASRLKFVSPIPYIRRLVVTGFDKAAILHGFFGDDYVHGIMPHVECERRNYLFTAKHGGWRSCKKQYDHGSGGGPDESVPFMKPLEEARMEELTAAEKAWSSWLAMEDWMVGPRAPGDASVSSSQTGPPTAQPPVGDENFNGVGEDMIGAIVDGLRPR